MSRAVYDVNKLENFRIKLFKEMKVKENKENLALYQFAWKHGFEGGLEEVRIHFRDLVGMKKDLNKQF